MQKKSELDPLKGPKKLSKISFLLFFPSLRGIPVDLSQRFLGIDGHDFGNLLFSSTEPMSAKIEAELYASPVDKYQVVRVYRRLRAQKPGPGILCTAVHPRTTLPLR